MDFLGFCFFLFSTCQDLAASFVPPVTMQVKSLCLILAFSRGTRIFIFLGIYIDNVSLSKGSPYSLRK